MAASQINRDELVQTSVRALKFLVEHGKYKMALSLSNRIINLRDLFLGS